MTYYIAYTRTYCCVFWRNNLSKTSPNVIACFHSVCASLSRKHVSKHILLKLSVISISTHPKYLKMLPPGRPNYSLKCVKTVGGWGFAPDSTGGAYSVPPDPLAGLRGAAKRQLGTPLRGVRRGGPSLSTARAFLFSQSATACTVHTMQSHH